MFVGLMRSFFSRGLVIGFKSRSSSSYQNSRRYTHSRNPNWKLSFYGISRNAHNVPRHSSHFSPSDPSPNLGFGFLDWYLRMLDTRPFITKSATTSLLYIAADLTSQAITLPSAGTFDSTRTLRMGAFGLLMLGPAQHLWFNFLSKIMPKRDLFTTLKKILMGQVIFGPSVTSVFFSYNAALQGESREEIAARLKRDMISTLRNGLAYWPICDFITYKFVPVHLQPLANSLCAYFWTVYLTYVASLKKASAD